MDTGFSVLVTGGDGQVGRALRHLLPMARYASHDELDVTDMAAVRRALNGANVVVHLAALTDVDRCQSEPDLAVAVNSQGARNVAEAASSIHARVIGLSSDYVFDGASACEYRENDEPRPISAYGASKLAGEQALLGIKKALVIRTSWVFGDGHNFVRTIINAARAGREIAVVSDQRGRPTAAVDLARAILYLLTAETTGLLNVTGDGPATTWAGLAERALAAANINTPINRLSTTDYSSRVRRNLAPRPANSLLALDRARALRVPLRDWRTAVDDYASIV